MMTPAQSDSGFPVRIDFERILQTISSQIYDTEFAFLRENVQNAIDAIRIQASRDHKGTSDPSYRIEISISGKVCAIHDNGIGMTKAELENHFWTMGASGKNTPEAKAAGCIGLFGIGGFANFGVCDTLEVISRTGQGGTEHRTWLSKTDFATDRFALPKVNYAVSDELEKRGTIVRGTSRKPFDVAALSRYLKEFVRYVPESVYIQGTRLSKEPLPGPTESYRALEDPVTREYGDELGVEFQLFVDEGNNLAAKLLQMWVRKQPQRLEGFVRLTYGPLAVYKRGFRLCSVHVATKIGASGVIDCDVLRPTAGRDSLDIGSSTLLNRVFTLVEDGASDAILEDEDLLNNYVRLIPDLIAKGHLEQLGVLSVRTLDGSTLALSEVRKASRQGKSVYYTSTDRRTSAAETLQARGHYIIAVSSNYHRRSAEVQYLEKYCNAQRFENVIECLEIYKDLDQFEIAVLAELEAIIKRLFKPSPFRLTPGKLTVDTPIYWTSRKEEGATVVFVDTRHGEIEKLRPLGLSALLWSMLEAFAREYLGDTLKRESPKFFGSGAVNLDAFSKAQAELWELVSTDIAVSTIDTPAGPRRHRGGRIDFVSFRDIASVQISAERGVTEQESSRSDSESPKLLKIVDQTRRTGLDGYYLRIPQSATAAFGDLIKTFSSFAVVWFANRVTWQGSDLKSTAFLFDVTLDRLIAVDGNIGHGAVELTGNQVQTYRDQIYFLIPPVVVEYLVPKSDAETIRIEVKHELVDLAQPRSWTAKEPK